MIRYKKTKTIIAACLLSIVITQCTSGDGKENASYMYGENGEEPIKQARTKVVFANNDTTDIDYIQTDDSLFLYEGDIEIPQQVFKEKILGNIKIGATWPAHTVYYSIDTTLSKIELQKIENAIIHWTNNTPLRFLKQPGRNDRIVFIRHTKPTIGSSTVGYTGRVQYVRLGIATGTGVAIHEIGHAVGLFHEQNRKDRDEFVTIQWDNIREKYKHNFKITGDTAGAYDFHSVMHYQAHAFSRNGKATIVPKDPKIDVVFNSVLSEGDIAAVRKLYGL